MNRQNRKAVMSDFQTAMRPMKVMKLAMSRKLAT